MSDDDDEPFNDELEERRRLLVGRTVMRLRLAVHGVTGEEWVVLTLDNGVDIHIFDQFGWLIVHPQRM